MSGIEVVGSVSAILSILDITLKLYKGIGDTRNLPQAFREAAKRLPLVRDSLQAAEGHIRQCDKGGNSWEAIEPTIQSCREKAERLSNILEDIAPVPNASRIQRYQMSARRLGKARNVEELMKGILEDVSLLTGYHAIRAATEAQVVDLQSVVDDVSRAPASAPTIRSLTFMNSGTGKQFNNTGSGTENINTGSGRQYVAQSMTFRKNSQ
jgi:hypothetical protein